VANGSLSLSLVLPQIGVVIQDESDEEEGVMDLEGAAAGDGSSDDEDEDDHSEDDDSDVSDLPEVRTFCFVLP